VQTEVGHPAPVWTGDDLARGRSLVPRWLPYVLVAAVAAVSGWVAGGSDAHPTGEEGPDRLLVVALAVATTGLGAFAPWWLLLGLAFGAGVAAVLLGSAALVVLAVVAVVASIGAAAIERAAFDEHLELMPAVVAAACVTQVALRLEGGFHGLPSIVAAALLGGLVLGALGSESFGARALAMGVGAVVGLMALGAVGATAYASMTARADADRGVDRLRDGFDALDTGDTGTAETAFAEAAAALEAAEARLDEGWGRTARWLPVVAQHRQAALAVLVSGRQLAATASASSADFDADALRLARGRIDPNRVRNLSVPLDDLEGALSSMRAAVDQARSPWLLWVVDDLLDDLDTRVVDATGDTDLAREAAAVVPELLGTTSPRRYVVLFTSPAVSRGLGGAVAGFASVVVDDGNVAVERTGSLGDLVLSMPPEGVALTGPAEVVAALEPVVEATPDGASPPPDGVVPPTIWSHVTRPTDMASVGTLVAQLYPRSGGGPVDGVLVADPAAVAATLALTGPLSVEGLGVQLTSENVEEYLLTEQFAAGAEALDVLPQLVPRLVDRLLTVRLPAPRDVGEMLRPVADEGRLVAWARRAEEQAFLDRIHVAGTVATDGADLLAVTVDNEIGNGIDPYLERAVEYEVNVFPGADRVTAELDVTIANGAPSEGLSVFAIGNFSGEPAGTSRSTVSILTPFELDVALRGGDEVVARAVTEGGLNRYAVPVVLGSGESTTVRFRLVGDLRAVSGDDGAYTLVVRPQPAATAEQLTLEIGGPEGSPVTVVDGPVAAVDGLLRFTGEPAETFRVRVGVG
jgi:hypothetical protein